MPRRTKTKAVAGRRLAAAERASGAESTFDMDVLRSILDVIDGTDVTRVVWKNGEQRIDVQRHIAEVANRGGLARSYSGSIPMPVPSAPRASAPSRGPQAGVALLPPSHSDKKGHVVTSPFVGTFYRSPAPDQPAYVEEGTVVKKGQILCIVEAMKLMNEIEADVAGKVVEILVDNGRAVEFGQPLFRIEPA